MTLRDIVLSTDFDKTATALSRLYPADVNYEAEYRQLFEALRTVKPTFGFFENVIIISRLRSGLLAAANVFQGSVSDLVSNQVDNPANATAEEIAAVFMHDFINGRDNGFDNFKHALD